jgi:two-component system, sensor histidine kinase LadS
MNKLYIALMVCFFGLQAAWADHQIKLNSDTENFIVGFDAFVLEDPTGTLTFEDICKDENQKAFTLAGKSSLNFGFSNSSFWVKFTVKNVDPLINDYFLEIGFPTLDSIAFYNHDAAGQWRVEYAGDHYPFHQRAFKYRNFLFRLNQPDTLSRDYYINLRTQSATHLPLNISRLHHFTQKKLVAEIVYGFFYGIMLIMMLYNFFIYLSLHDRKYLYYVLTTFCSTVFFASVNGHAFQYIWPEYVWWANMVVPVSMGCLALASAIFSKSFLETRRYFPIGTHILNLIALSGVGIIIASFLFPYGTVVRVAASILALDAVCIFVSAIFSFINGNQAAKYFVLAWTVYLAGALLIILRNFGFLPFNFITSHSVEIGSVLEILLLSFALSDKYRLMRQEKEQAQALALAYQQKANLELEEKVKERTNALKRQNEEIESSIKYAKTIQDVVLPEPEKLNKLLPHSFIFYKPKNIVSGDFYWLVEKTDKIIILAADCTGHGVPGAFMAILGNTLLNEIVNLRNITAPDLILRELHISVRNTLKQAYNGNRDGMDVAVCVLHKDKNLLEFSGAKSHLVYIQNGKPDIIKGDKISIGGEQMEADRNFTLHSLPVVENNAFYLFSDGFQDQFGGPKGRKFMLQRLKDLLFSIYQLPFAKQKNLLKEELLKWSKGHDQVDDILVIGFNAWLKGIDNIDMDVSKENTNKKTKSNQYVN